MKFYKVVYKEDFVVAIVSNKLLAKAILDTYKGMDYKIEVIDENIDFLQSL